MGTADYCLIVAVLFFALVTLCLKHDEHRRRDRRQRNLGPPNGIERRSGKDRRGNSTTAFVLWTLRSRWSKVKKWF